MTPGAIIDARNAAAYERFLPQAAKFAVEHGFRIRIAPSEHLDWSAGFERATEKYSPQVRLDAQDQMVNYVAGLPFPLIDVSDPKAAVKIAYNWHMGPFMPDDFSLAPWSSHGYSAAGGMVQPQGAMDYACDEFLFLRYAHRTEVEPRPTLGDNPQGVEWKARCTHWVENAFQTDTGEGAGIWIRFLDPHHPDEFYGLSGVSRRVRRSAVTLSYPNEGCRGCHQPYWAYALPKTENYSYRLLGTISLLACLTANEEPAGLRQAAEGLAMGEEPFEMRDAYMLEMAPQDPAQNLRTLVFIDGEIYVWLAAEFFENGQLRATAVPLWRKIPSPEGGNLFHLAGNFYVPAGRADFFRSLVPPRPNTGTEAGATVVEKINSGEVSQAPFNPNAMSR